MNKQQLKNSILQWAIQGKLVPQIASEGTAEDLLKEIRAEKEKLVKEGKLKKKDLDVKPIEDDEIPFEIPESWRFVRLGNVINIKSGDGLTSKDMIKGDIPVYGGNGITGYHNKSNVECETVVIGRVGFYCGSVHVTGKKAWVTDNAFITTYPIDYINREYLVYCLRTMNLGNSFNATAQPVVSGKKIYPMLFPLPPLSEQKRIVAKIEELMPLVEDYGKAQERLEDLNKALPEKLKKSILQEAIMGKLVPQDPKEGTADELLAEIRKEKERLVKEGKLKKKDLEVKPIEDDEVPFEIPESWRWVRLGDIVGVYGGKRIPAGSKLTKKNTGHKYIRVADMKNESVKLDDIHYVLEKDYEGIKKYTISKDDLYITVAGTIGAVGEIPAELDNANLTENANKLVLLKTEKRYLLKTLLSPYLQKQIKDVTTKVGQPKLAILRIQKLLVPLPPLSEQKRIVAKIEELMKRIDNIY